MKKFLIGFGIALLVLPVLSSAQAQDYTVNGDSDEAKNNTNSVLPEGMEPINERGINTDSPNVPEGMEVVSERGLNVVVPKGSKVDFIGAQLFVEDTVRYMSRRFEEMDTRLKKEEDASQKMSRTFEEIDTRLKKIEQKLEEQDQKIEALKTTAPSS
jgi:predicted ribosome quality control (RQC) complex YloA/Tae2 family protein